VVTSPGWFGKLPMLGDFAHRRLPLDVVAACDAWLSHGVAASRQALGDAWQSAYLNAPLWCFAWAPQVVDAQWWIGVMMPSVDTAGRYFPLLVMTPSDAAPMPSHTLAQWYDAVAACALETLMGEVTLAAFESSLAEIEDPTPLQQTMVDAQDTLPQSPDATIAALRTLATRLQGHSTWWRLSRDDAAPPLVSHGLPAADRFVALLQGSA
jgi:type VI secretion system protein ImpM